MKKITFLMCLLITSIGFSQELVTNGDFESGIAPWYGNAANAVDDGSGNFVNEANILAAGTPFSVNLSQEVILENGMSYELVFDAYTDATTGTRSMVVGLGQAAAPFTALTQDPVLTDVPQTFSYTFTINYGDAVADRVIFDMGAETGFVFIDNVSVQETVDLCNDGILNNEETEVDCGGPNCEPCIVPPAEAAPFPPTRNVSDVISFYSDAYTNVAVETFDAGFCGFGATSEVEIEGDPTRTYSSVACVGWEFTNNRVDASAMTHVHFDYYTSDTDLVGKVFNVKFSDWAGGSSEASALEINTNTGTTPALVSGSWVSVDLEIDFSNPIFAGSPTRSDLAQFVISSNLDNAWLDNVYFHNNTVLGIDEFDLNQVKVSPNPTNSVWNVTTVDQNINTIRVYDVLGKEVLSLEPNSNEAVINASGLINGLYLAKISSANGERTIKLVKN